MAINNFSDLLQWVPSAIQLAMLFIFASIWLKTSVPGFGFLAAAELLSMLNAGVSRLGIFPYSSESYEVIAATWILVAAVQLVGGVLLYRHYRGASASDNASAS